MGTSPRSGISLIFKDSLFWTQLCVSESSCMAKGQRHKRYCEIALFTYWVNEQKRVKQFDFTGMLTCNWWSNAYSGLKHIDGTLWSSRPVFPFKWQGEIKFAEIRLQITPLASFPVHPRLFFHRRVLPSSVKINYCAIHNSGFTFTELPFAPTFHTWKLICVSPSSSVITTPMGCLVVTFIPLDTNTFSSLA